MPFSQKYQSKGRTYDIAIYPGTFDPITLGHLNIIKRASRAFDKLIVCVMVNKSKTPVFSSQERLEQVRKVTERFENVEVDFSEKMLAEYARDRMQLLLSGDCVLCRILKKNVRWR